MSAKVDTATQIVPVGALVHIDSDVLAYGVAFVSEDYPPLRLRFAVGEDGTIEGFEFAEIPLDNPEVTRLSLVKAGRKDPAPVITIPTRKFLTL